MHLDLDNTCSLRVYVVRIFLINRKIICVDLSKICIPTEQFLNIVKIAFTCTDYIAPTLLPLDE